MAVLLRVSVLLVLLLTVGMPAGAQSDTFPPDVSSELNALIERTYESEPDLPGLVVLVDVDGMRYERSIGFDDWVAETPMPVDGAFRIGSVSKMFTATVILQLMEAGELALEDTLGEWLPEVAPNVDFGEDITIRQLLNHTSGIVDYMDPDQFVIDMENSATQVGDTAVLDCGLQEPNALLRDYVFDAEAYYAPGALDDWEYSNSNYLLLGMIIEEATDSTLAQAYRDYILDPLNMTDSYTFCGEDPTSQVVHGYGEVFGEFLDVIDFNDGGHLGDGSLVSTAQDLVIYARALFEGRLFDDPTTLDIMLTADNVGNYGLGVTVEDGVYGHEGALIGYMAALLYDAETEGIIIALANTDFFDISEFQWVVYDVMLNTLE